MGAIMALPDDSTEVLEFGADLARPEITTSHSPTSAEDEFSDRRDTGAPDPDEVDRAICGEFSQIWDDHSFFTPRHRPPRVRVTSVRSDRKSTRLNSSHVAISYAVFCLRKKRAQATDNAGEQRR